MPSLPTFGGDGMTGDLAILERKDGRGALGTFAVGGPIIEVKNLKKYFSSGLFRKKVVKAVDGVSFEIAKGEVFGLVGESGCGKTTVGRCILRLLEPTSGGIRFDGLNLLALKGRKLRTLRQRMQIIFQDADGSLNPRMRTRDLLLEPLRVHRRLDGKAAERLGEIMEMVNLTPDLADRYPHELSGGQRQRIGIARALSLAPDFIVADEAAASLDLLVQSQIVNLLERFRTERRTGYLYISHNLNLVRRIADRMAVMYLGKFVEMGPTEAIFTEPAHPYTDALLASVPTLAADRRPAPLAGEPPSPLHLPSGCRFHPRCPRAQPLCARLEPELREIAPGHAVACHRVS